MILDKMKKNSYISYEDWINKEKKRFRGSDEKYHELKKKTRKMIIKEL